MNVFITRYRLFKTDDPHHPYTAVGCTDKFPEYLTYASVLGNRDIFDVMDGLGLAGCGLKCRFLRDIGTEMLWPISIIYDIMKITGYDDGSGS